MMCVCVYASEAELITQNECDHLREELQEDLWRLSYIVTLNCQEKKEKDYNIEGLT